MAVDFGVYEYIERILNHKKFLDKDEYSSLDNSPIVALIHPPRPEDTTYVLEEALDATHHCFLCLSKVLSPISVYYILYTDLIVLKVCFCSEECLSLFCVQKGTVPSDLMQMYERTQRT